MTAREDALEQFPSTERYRFSGPGVSGSAPVTYAIEGPSLMEGHAIFQRVVPTEPRPT